MAIVDNTYRFLRRLKLRYSKFRADYRIRKEGKFFRIVIPNRHKGKIKWLKYIFAAIGLFSALVTFNSILISFGFALLIFLISGLLERTVFSHPVAFIHALPEFELDGEKWLGMGFGYARPNDGKPDIPVVSMILSDKKYAQDIQGLLLKWTGGSYTDEEKRIQATVVVLNKDEYIFLCYPNPKQPLAERFFEEAKENLRKESLEDEIAEHQLSLIFGKRCFVGPGSYFPEFRRRHKAGVPVMFDFILPPYDVLRPQSEVKPIVLFDFTIKDKKDLTRKDMAYGAIGIFKIGGKWLGPPEQAPKKKWWYI